MTKIANNTNTQEALQVSDKANCDLQMARDVLLKLKAGPIFTIHLPDGQAVRLHWDGPRGLTGTGLRFENNCGWMLASLTAPDEREDYRAHLSKS
ncbi:MAG: hypothetical protein JNM01_12640 [Delftia acidovorans]|nr:hypothetical protein [Delftia acidovorans]